MILMILIVVIMIIIAVRPGTPSPLLRFLSLREAADGHTVTQYSTARSTTKNIALTPRENNIRSFFRSLFP